MSDIYDEMQDVATELFTDFQQGVLVLQHWTVDATGKRTGNSTSVPLVGVVRPVEQQFVDGTRIIDGSDMAVFAVPSVTPLMTDKITVDGRTREIVKIVRVPNAGTAVAYKVMIN